MKKIIGTFILVLTLLLIPSKTFALTKGVAEKIAFPTDYISLVKGENIHNLYYTDSDIYEYDITTNKFTKIWTIEKGVYSTYTTEDYLYVWSAEDNANKISRITCINVATKKQVFTYTVPVQVINNGSIVADSKQNVYILGDDIMEYNKSGTLIGRLKKEKDTSRVSSLLGFNKDETILLVDLGYYHEGAIKLSNNNISKGTIHLINSMRTPNWSFINDETAINQYGEIAVFQFSEETSKPYSYTLKTQGTMNNISTRATFYETSNSIFANNGTGNLIEYRKTDFKKIGKIEIHENSTITKVVEKDGDLYVTYQVETNDKYNPDNYVIRISLKDKIESKTITVSKHSSQNHTMEEVIKKYKEARPTFNYSNSLYETDPVLTTPYYEGSLKSEVKSDTLKQINFYRWLSSLNSLTINTSKMARSQKGALIQAVNKKLTHYPEKPSDMDNAFYKEAYAGANAKYEKGDTYSGNVSYGTRIDQSVKGFIEDRNNTMPGVGHRSSMLDPYAYAISFGYVKSYSAISIYYDDMNNNVDTFYPYPTAGYFPTESLYSQEKTMWSVWIGQDYEITADTQIELTYNGKTYKISKLNYDDMTRTLSYYLPQDLRNQITTANSRYLNGATVKVQVLNLEDTDINTVNLSYETTFIAVENVPLESIEMLTTEENGLAYSVTKAGETIYLKKNLTYDYITRMEPTNAVVSNLKFQIADTSIATIDPTNKKIVTKKGGKTTLTVTEKTTGKMFTYQIYVMVDATDVKFDREEVTVEVGKKIQLNPIFTPSDASFNYDRWTSGNSSVATVDENGLVTAIKKGTATIYYQGLYTSNTKSISIKVKVVEPITSVSLDKTNLTIENGRTATLIATVNPSTTDADKTLAWMSNNTSVAIVDSTGKITAKGYGTAIITVKTSNGKTATATVIVPERKITQVILNKTSLTIEKGKTETLIATINPTNTTDSKTLTWTSNNTSVATIDLTGKITAKDYGTATITVKTSNGKTATATIKVVEKVPNVSYRTHVEDYGWQNYVNNGTMSGTEGKAKRLEGIDIKIDNLPYSGGIQYRTHIEDYGWESNWKANGVMSGTSGEAKRLEAIQIKLTGEMANHYDIYYRVHAENFGWLDWAKNGEKAGTAGYAYRLEGIQIVLVEKGSSAPGKTATPYEQKFIHYQTHVEDYGWQGLKYDGEMSGTEGEAKRLEGIKIALDNQEYSGNIEYRTHIEDYGWETSFKKNGEMSGTSGEAKRLEAIEIKLTGEMANHYDIYYRVHAENFGWLDWAKNGQRAGTAGYAYRLEGIEVILVKKNVSAPGSTKNPFYQK